MTCIEGLTLSEPSSGQAYAFCSALFFAESTEAPHTSIHATLQSQTRISQRTRHILLQSKRNLQLHVYTVNVHTCLRIGKHIPRIPNEIRKSRREPQTKTRPCMCYRGTLWLKECKTLTCTPAACANPVIRHFNHNLDDYAYHSYNIVSTFGILTTLPTTPD